MWEYFISSFGDFTERQLLFWKAIALDLIGADQNIYLPINSILTLNDNTFVSLSLSL